MDDAAVDVGEPVITTVVAEGQLLVVKSELVEDGRVQVVHMHLVLDREVAELVRLAVGEAGLEAAAGEEDGEARRVVVAAGAVALGVGRAALQLATQAAGLVVVERAVAGNGGQGDGGGLAAPQACEARWQA